MMTETSITTIKSDMTWELLRVLALLQKAITLDQSHPMWSQGQWVIWKAYQVSKNSQATYIDDLQAWICYILKSGGVLICKFNEKSITKYSLFMEQLLLT